MIELIHCHVPKTGGVSFLWILNIVYGKENVAFPWTWMDMVPEQGKGFDMLWHKWPELKKMWQSRIPNTAARNPNIRVLQGHHPVGLFSGLFPEAKRIAWVRHPVERVISHWKHDMAKKHQPKMPLEKYIELPHNRNIMTFYIGHYIDNMDWIGVLELFKDELGNLREFLGWSPDITKVNPIPHMNKSLPGPAVSPETKKKIADLNMKDMNLFAEVLSRKPGAQYHG